MLSIWPARPAAYSDESTLNETWSSYRRRASGLLLEGSNGRSDNLCNGPVAALCRIERDTTPSTPSSRGKKARAPDLTGRFTRRSSKEYKDCVREGCKPFEDLQALLEEHKAYRTVWKSNWRHFSHATPARRRGDASSKFDGANKSTAGAEYEFMQPPRLVRGDGLIFTIGWCFTHVSRPMQGRPDDVLTARER